MKDNIKCICAICKKASNLHSNHIIENCIICDKCLENVPVYIPKQQTRDYLKLKEVK